ncbi:putative Alba-like domain superfamily protein [Helianthus debilis subsp. tardiflorus]
MRLRVQVYTGQRCRFRSRTRGAIATVVTIAEILKNNGFAVEKKIMTSTVDMKDESRGRPIQKAKIEILLGKTDKFDELMAAAAEERGELADGEEHS